MFIAINAAGKIGAKYILDMELLGRPILEYHLRLAKALGAKKLLIILSREKQKDAALLISGYSIEHYFVENEAVTGADIILDIRDIYNLQTAQKSWRMQGSLKQSLIWRLNEEKDLGYAEAELKRSLWFPIGRYYIVPIAKFLSDRLARTKITPNQVTLVSFILGIASGFLLLFSYWPFYPIAALCHLLSWILDITDGKLARKKRVVSGYGAWFDSTIGEAMDYLVHLFIVFSIYLKTGQLWVVWAGVAYFIGKHIALFAMQTSAERFADTRDDSGVSVLDSGFRRTFSESLHFIHDADVRVHFLVLAILLNVPAVPLTTYAVYYNIWFIMKLGLEYIRFRRGVR
jgi:phosphatidylglycerophosphate synthase